MMSYRNLPRVVLALLLLCVFIQPAKATTVVMLSDTELVVNSRLIVAGRVVSMFSAWDDSASMIWTYVEVQTDRVLKGALPGTTIVLKQLGGSVGESGVHVFGQPRFAPGEHVLLYLNAGLDGSLHSAHTFIGKFSIVADATGREFVERSADAGNVEILSRATDDEVTNRAPLNNYLEKIQETLQREANRVAEIDSARAGELLLAVPTEYSRKKKQSRGYAPEFVLFGGGVRWMQADSGQPVTYYVNPNGSPIVGGATAEISRAMSAWSDQSGANIRLQSAGQTSNCGISINNVNTISFGDCLGQLDPPVGCSGVVGLTSISYIQDGKVIGGVSFNRLLEADIIFNKGLDCFLSNSANLAEVICHELGHSIGLAHPPDAAAIMWATAHGHGRDATLGADDKTGVLSIYPASGGGGGPAPTPVSITSLSLNDGVAGNYYNTTLTAVGGTPPYRWIVIGGALPPGLSLSTTGAIQGIPTGINSYSFAVQASDSGSPMRVDTRWLSISIRGSDAGSVPAISRVKVKGMKKLWIYGENFRADSYVLVNGFVFQPVVVQQEGSVGQILIKGKLNLGTQGTNYVVVVNGPNRSASFFF